MMLLILTIAIVVIAGIAFYNSYENNVIIGTVSLGVIVIFVAVLLLEVCLICSFVASLRARAWYSFISGS